MSKSMSMSKSMKKCPHILLRRAEFGKGRGKAPRREDTEIIREFCSTYCSFGYTPGIIFLHDCT